uniref:glycosyltransferase family 4 protein n=1 Tax=Thaumasiovibrio occultus TaxID=1891184 RepID=UPI000B361F5B|nr:glycosyltransferase family 4 protein [Thaumasiovibrio occultus]
MKILICSSYKDAWNSVRPEAETFIDIAKLGHQVTIATHGDADYIPHFKEFGIKIIDCYPKRKVCVQTIKTLRKELHNSSYDIVYALNSKTIPNAAFACVGFPHIRMITYRGTVGGLYRHDPTAYLTHLHPRVNGIICVAEEVRQDVLKHIWHSKENVVTIIKEHNIEWYSSDAINLETEFGIPKQAKVITCVANARPSKGVNILLEAFQSIDHPNLHLILIGRGMDTPQYKAMIKKGPNQTKVHFAGYRKDVQKILSATDIFVQPSISGEGMPKTVIEAMAAGNIVIATTTGGAKEIIKHKETGLIVPVNDVNAIVQAIMSVVNKPNQIGKNAHTFIRDEFSTLTAAEKHISYFKKLLHASEKTS